MTSFLERNSSIESGQNQKIGIILDMDLMPADFDLAEFRKELNVSYENFYPIISSTQKNLPEKYSLNAFNAKRLSWKATFEEGNEREFVNTTFTVLLNYFVNPSPELLILSAATKAKLKVGFPLEEKRLNDIEINADPKDHKLFISELKKYLDMIV
ncbi:MAG TPA: hypothetical protein VFM82_09285 [Flavobacteriaceae bacterium]|nr:hypothetical protein [Flavobacteriaceae bacterium]